MTSFARKMRREQERKARKAAMRDGLDCWHGTAAAYAAQIRREGLRPTAGRAGPYITQDYERAVRYAARATALRIDETGRHGPRAVVF